MTNGHSSKALCVTSDSASKAARFCGNLCGVAKYGATDLMLLPEQRSGHGLDV